MSTSKQTTRARPARSSRYRAAINKSYPYLLLSPALTVTLILSVLPLVYGISLSMQDWYLLNGKPPHWNGGHNWVQLVNDASFWQAFGRTWIWTGGTVLVELILGYPIALLLNRDTRVSSFLSALILTPWVIPFIVVAYGWWYLLDSRIGFLHALLRMVGIVGDRTILADPHLALFMITFISGWKGVPFMVVALLAALKEIPVELHEAAQIDGAGSWQRFWRITLPLTQNAAVVISVILGLLAFYSFDLAWIMTQGGPDYSTTIVGIKIYQTFFTDLRPSYAATISTSMLVVLLIATLLSLQLRRKSDT